MPTYEKIKQQYRPNHIKVLLIAESPPPAAAIQSSRHFYRTDKIRADDRLFVNTIKALYPDAADLPETELEQEKAKWLKKFQADGRYMTEALQESLAHEVTKHERQALIRDNLPKLIGHIKTLVGPATKIILIKSNVFDVAAQPLRQAGFTVLNEKLLDYPGHFNQKAYREKLANLVAKIKSHNKNKSQL
ncbi:MAG TPA: hypothetical protein VMY99_00155 [Nevskiaceae bacterium]|nr:hypothetical protein [Nevskiaceae bacterium]